jgi:arylsulfatase A-like enzyme
MFLMHFPHSHRSSYFTSLRSGDWKIIYHYLPTEKQPRYQLFHLKDDPYEQTDLATKDPNMLGKMMKELIATLENHDAQYPQDKDGKELRPQLP